MTGSVKPARGGLFRVCADLMRRLIRDDYKATDKSGSLTVSASDSAGSYEYCVLCGKKTEILRDTPIDKRECYVEGGGQLCRDCWCRINTTAGRG